jgi:hypothetical protein
MNTAKIILGILFIAAGTTTLIWGWGEGEGLVMQFAPKPVVGLVTIAFGVLLLASIGSPAAEHAVSKAWRLDKRDHDLQELLGAAAGVPFSLFFAGLCGAIALGAVRDRDPLDALIPGVLAIAGVFGFFFDTAYLHLTEDPITMLQHL